MSVTTAKYKLFEEPPGHIHDRKRRGDPNERKREFLRLEQFVDARQCLVNVDLAPVSPRNPERQLLHVPLPFAPAQTAT